MDNITSLKRQESAHLDVRAVRLLENALGRTRCREVMEETCYDLIDKLGAIESALHGRRIEEAMVLARDIAGLSAQIGLDDFSLAARNLAQCLPCPDRTAQSAVAARMLRLGETSLLSLLNLTEDPYL